LARVLADIWWFIRRYTLPYKWWYIAGVAALLVTNLFTVAIPYFLQKALESVDPVTGDGQIERWIAWMMGLALGLVVVRTASRILVFYPGRESETVFRTDYFRRLLSHQAPFFRDVSTGDLMSRGTNDIQYVRALAGYAALQVFNLAIALPLNLWMMVRISGSLTLGCIIPLALAGLVMRKGVLSMLQYVRVMQEELSALSGEVLESYHGVRVVQDYGAQEVLLGRFDLRNDRYVSHQCKIVFIRAFLLPVVYVVGNLGILILLYWGGKQVALGELHFSAVSAFAVYVANIVAALVSLGWVLSVIQRGAVSLRRVLSIFEHPLPPTEGRITLPEGGLDLAVSHLHFQYSGSDREGVLTDVSFKLAAGKTLGIYGPTGSGKTTLLRLLTRLEMPPPNTIRWGGVDVCNVTLDDLRERMAVVPQTAYLFSRTLRQNIGFGVPRSAIDDERVEEVIGQACLTQEVALFDDGLETLVGERGVILSGGQRQRATLARALYRRAPILILDDTLAAVDHDTESRLIKTMLDSNNEATTLIVSHRVSVLSRADHILVLDMGRIVQQGTHRQLMEEGGLYTQAWQAHLSISDHSGGVDG